MGNLLEIARIQDLQSFEALHADWNEVLSRSHTQDIFLTWEWLFAWWKNIGRHKNELWLLAVKTDGKLAGLLPLMRNSKTKSLVRFKRLENIGNPDCDVGGMISTQPEVCAKAAAQYLIEHGREWDLLEINELPASGIETRSLLACLHECGYGLSETAEEHFYIPFTESWDSYYSRLSKNLKHNYKRRLKRAQEMGNVRIERYTGGDLEWKHFETIFEISKNSNFPDLYRSEENQAFHYDLFRLMKDRGWIQIEILFIDQKPVAFQYGFLYGGRYEDWRGGIDKNYEFIAPGKLLMMRTLEERFKSGLRENDFLRGKHTYKTDWLPSVRGFKSIRAFNSRAIKARLAYEWEKYRKGNRPATTKERNE